MGCIVRAIPGTDAYDVTTPYGYGGPVGEGDFQQAYERWCDERGIVSTFLRFHPLFENYRGASHATYASPTVGWPLKGDLLAGMHGKHRNVVRKAEKVGVTVEATPAPDDLSAFVSLYEQTMRRQDAAAYYFFPTDYWEGLSALRDRLVRFDAVAEGEIVASALCLRGDRWLHYHLGATADSARDFGASNLLLYEAARWGQEQGLEEFHLGGGAGAKEDSLFTFKQRFSPEQSSRVLGREARARRGGLPPTVTRRRYRRRRLLPGLPGIARRGRIGMRSGVSRRATSLSRTSSGGRREGC